MYFCEKMFRFLQNGGLLQPNRKQILPIQKRGMKKAGFLPQKKWFFD